MTPDTAMSVRSQTFAGILLMLGAMIALPMMDGMAKYLAQTYPLWQVVWARYAFHALVLAPILLMRHPVRAMWPRRIELQLLRSFLMLAATLFFFTAISRMPLADALAIAFVSPLIVTALSPWLLGETVGLRRYMAVAVGFMGALLIIRPGLGVFDIGAAFALGTGTCYALYLIVTRKLAGTAPPLVSLAYTALVGTIVTTVALPFVWQQPTIADLGLMLAMGVLAAAGHVMVIKAIEFASPALLAPLTYAEIVTATVIGYLVFSEFPDNWTWSGIVVVAASGVYISWRERVRRA